LIVGERRLPGSSRPTILSVGDLDVPTPAELGLQDVYDIYVPGCTGACQRSFTVSHDGSQLGWLDGIDLVIVDSTTFTEVARVPIGGSVDDGNLELSIESGYAVVSRRPPGDDDRPWPLLVGTTEPSVTELAGALGMFAVAPRALPASLATLVEPVLHLEGCPTRSTPRHEGPLGVFIHPHAGPHPAQLFANPALGTAGPYAIVERFFTDQRSTTPDPFEPGDVHIAGDGQSDASWVLDDGSEVYLRARGFDSDQVIGLANSLAARPADWTISGFDLDTADTLGVQIVSETASLRGAVAGTNCQIDRAGFVSALVLDGEPVATYALSLDWSPVPYVVDLGGGRLLSVIAGQLPLEEILTSLTDGSG
jgi:hypothetical protein